jgi:predicted Zn-dependent protease
MRKYSIVALGLTLSILLRLTLSVGVALAEGEDDPMWNRPTPEKKLVKIGARLLQANQIPSKISFILQKHQSSSPNAYADTGYAVVYIEKELLDYIDSDDELAAVLGHEIAHVVKCHGRNGAVVGGLMGGLVVGLSVLAGVPISPTGGMVLGQSAKALTAPTNQPLENEADRLGIDYMVKAGYNPLAMETIMQKIASDGWVLWRTHPGGTARLKRIHDYIATTYPQWLVPSKGNVKPVAVVLPSSSMQPALPTYVPQKALPNTMFSPSLEAPTVPTVAKP